MFDCMDFGEIEPLTRQRGEYGELLIMPADGRWDLTLWRWNYFFNFSTFCI